MPVTEGKLTGAGISVAIVVSRSNRLISNGLLEGTVDSLSRHGVSQEDIEIYWTPGAWELSLMAKEAAMLGKYDAVIALGAVIGAEISDCGIDAMAAAKGLSFVGMEQRIPVIFGVLVCDTQEQALQRSGGKSGNRGAECARTAIEMANLVKNIREGEEKH
jgi:6,7-dimethyl-8-ribityllumazine synthase